MKNQYTLTVYSEEQIGLINKLTTMFIRKSFQLESLNISLCEIEKMHRFSIVIKETSDNILNLKAQIEKIIEVFKCYVSNNHEIVYKQIALYKIPTSVLLTEKEIDFLLKEFDLRIIELQEEFTILQTTGTEDEIIFLTNKLNGLGLIEFVQSSKISLIKSSQGFYKELLEMDLK